MTKNGNSIEKKRVAILKVYGVNLTGGKKSTGLFLIEKFRWLRICKWKSLFSEKLKIILRMKCITKKEFHMLCKERSSENSSEILKRIEKLRNSSMKFGFNGKEKENYLKI